ncbi:MAG: hypothetical protein ACJATI_005030 [Halioglobus sp.]
MIFISGCRTKKIVHTGPVPDRSKLEIFTALSDHNYDFEWYACVTGITLDTPDEGVSGKSYIRMRKDSIIWASVKKIGIEAVRTLITPKTYIAANRIDHTYQKGSTEEVFAKMGLSLDFMDMQQAIFGNIIMPDSNAISIEKVGEHYVVKATDQDLQLKYWVNAYDLELDKVKMVDYRGKEINIDYDDYRTVESGEKVAFYRHYAVPYNGNGDAEIFMKVKEIEINVPKKTRFSLSNRYERVN